MILVLLLPTPSWYSNGVSLGTRCLLLDADMREETTGCFKSSFDSTSQGHQVSPWLTIPPRFLLSGDATTATYPLYWNSGLQGRNNDALLATPAGVFISGATDRSGAPPLPPWTTMALTN